MDMNFWNFFWLLKRGYHSETSMLNTVFPLISAGPQISAGSLGIHIDPPFNSTSPLISAAPLNAALIKIVTIYSTSN